MMKINILTLFPEMFTAVLNSSILGRAVNKGILSFELYNIRDYTENKHRHVDDSPFGGGAGMVLSPQPVFDAVNHVKELNDPWNGKIVYMSPEGRTLTPDIAKDYTKYDNIMILCGHYEGIDQRIIDNLVDDEVSIGDYILTGGELPAMVFIDCISRLIPGVLNKEESYMNESFTDGLLEYPQYTRPESYKGYNVPEVLLSGHHKNIKDWRRKQSLLITYKKRPELLNKVELTKDDIEFLNTL